MSHAFEPTIQDDCLVFHLTADDLGLAPSDIWNPSPSRTHRLTPYPIPQQLRIGIFGYEETAAKFSPPPFAVVVGSDTAQAAVGLQADAGWHLWNEAFFSADADGLTITVDLEGQSDPAEVAGHVRAVVLAGDVATDRYDLLGQLLRQTYPQSRRHDHSQLPRWWFRPIYCGWGDQVTAAMHMEGLGPERRALAWCIQGLYERWIARLEQADVPVGTVIIDHGWSPAGWWEPNEERWPDLKGFIQRQHDAGRRVLLWIPTFLWDGLPDEWCVFADDRKLVADPTNPDYLAHIRQKVHELLSPEGLNADGFKVDQLAYTPSQRRPRGGPRFGWTSYGQPPRKPIGLRNPGLWGCELLYHLQKTIYTAAKAAKPDCLVTSSTVHPYFHDTLDMVRLHDTGQVEHDVFEPMKARADLAKAAFPNIPIDTDDWVHTDYDLWMRYTVGSPQIGVPCIFYAEHFMLSWKQEPATRLIPLEDLRAIGNAWRAALPELT